MTHRESYIIGLLELMNRLDTIGEDDRCEEIREQLDVHWASMPWDERKPAEAEALKRYKAGKQCTPQK